MKFLQFTRHTTHAMEVFGKEKSYITCFY